MYQPDIEVCSVCHFRLPQIMGYVGIIHCHCGKVVFDSGQTLCTTNATTDLIDDTITISSFPFNLSHSSLLSL